MESEFLKPEIEQELPKTPSSLGVDAGINMLSPHPESLSLKLLKLTLKLDIQARNRRNEVQINQKHANERVVRQYDKQRSVKIFELHQKVSVAVSALDRASIDDERIFGRILHVYEDSYIIQTKYGVLDRNYPTSELNELPDNIDLGIPDPVPTKKVTLHLVSAQESTTEKGFGSLWGGGGAKRGGCEERGVRKGGGVRRGVGEGVGGFETGKEAQLNSQIVYIDDYCFKFI